jgi:hypothetical protein
VLKSLWEFSPDYAVYIENLKIKGAGWFWGSFGKVLQVISVE